MSCTEAKEGWHGEEQEGPRPLDSIHDLGFMELQRGFEIQMEWQLEREGLKYGGGMAGREKHLTCKVKHR